MDRIGYRKLSRHLSRGASEPHGKLSYGEESTKGANECRGRDNGSGQRTNIVGEDFFFFPGGVSIVCDIGIDVSTGGR